MIVDCNLTLLLNKYPNLSSDIENAVKSPYVNYVLIGTKETKYEEEFIELSMIGFEVIVAILKEDVVFNIMENQYYDFWVATIALGKLVMSPEHKGELVTSSITVLTNVLGYLLVQCYPHKPEQGVNYLHAISGIELALLRKMYHAYKSKCLSYGYKLLVH